MAAGDVCLRWSFRPRAGVGLMAVIMAAGNGHRERRSVLVRNPVGAITQAMCPPADPLYTGVVLWVSVLVTVVDSNVCATCWMMLGGWRRR